MMTDVEGAERDHKKNNNYSYYIMYSNKQCIC